VAHERLAAMTVKHWRAEVLRITRDLRVLEAGVLPSGGWPDGWIDFDDWHGALMGELETALGALAAARAGLEPGFVAHEHSPVLVDEARPGDDRTVAVVVSPVAARAAVEAYRERVLEAFRAWDMRPGDTRTWHEVVMGVDLP